MSDYERFGSRDLGFSRWHRQKLRDAGMVAGARCGMVDVDCLEYCTKCGMNLFMVETARDVHQLEKATTQLQRLAMSANIDAYCLLYTPIDDDCPTKGRCRTNGCQHGISAFRIKRVSPIYDDFWTPWDPDAMARWIHLRHDQHEAVTCGTPAWLASDRTPVGSGRSDPIRVLRT